MNYYLRFLYLFGFAIAGISMPFFHVGMSIGTIWVASVAVLHLGWELHNKAKPAFLFKSFLRNTPAMLMVGLYLAHVLWLVRTEDIDFALNDLRIKLPLLAFGFSAGLLPPLGQIEIRRLLIAFAASCTIALVWCAGLEFSNEQTNENARDAAGIFISHIRFGLMTGMAASIWVWLSISPNNRWVFISLALVVTAGQWYLGMTTGIAMTAIAAAIFVYRLGGFFKVAVALSAVLLILGLGWQVKNYWTPKEDFASRLTHSAAGERYEPNSENQLLENGYFVYNHIASRELEKGWKKVSAIPIDVPDGRGNHLRATLIRHLTSLGLTKDSLGLTKLSPLQIAEIERGIASPSIENQRGMSRRLSEMFFEIDAWKNGGNPSGNSLTQRLEFQKAAVNIIRQNLWFGVGTGDTQLAFDNYYEKTGSVLNEKSRLRAHQQYLTFILSFGIFGFLLFAWLLWAAPYKSKALFQFLPIVFIIIASVSFLTEDTLETQAGATFFSWFYAALIIAGVQAFGRLPKD